MKKFTKRSLSSAGHTALIGIIMDLQKQTDTAEEKVLLSEKHHEAQQLAVIVRGNKLAAQLNSTEETKTLLARENAELVESHRNVDKSLAVIQGVVASRLATAYPRGNTPQKMFNPDGTSFVFPEDTPEDYYFLKNLEANLSDIIDPKQEINVNILDLAK